MKARYINLTLFLTLVIFIISLPLVFVDRYLSSSDSPWQLKAFNEDSLSSFYKNHYHILEDSALSFYLQDTTKPIVMILIDGWGVPYNESLLEKDFSIFENNASVFAIHKRAFNVTRLAENEELKNFFSNGLFISSGDSLNCNKEEFSPNVFFREKYCFANLSDFKMIEILDSLLSEEMWGKVAWTIHQTQKGDSVILHSTLQKLSKAAKDYPNIQFIIQGTHRPTLGSPEIRRKYLASWVPAIFINCILKLPMKKND